MILLYNYIIWKFKNETILFLKSNKLNDINYQTIKKINVNIIKF